MKLKKPIKLKIKPQKSVTKSVRRKKNYKSRLPGRPTSCLFMIGSTACCRMTPYIGPIALLVTFVWDEQNASSSYLPFF